MGKRRGWDTLEKYLPVITLLAFIAGIILASMWQGFADGVNWAISLFIDAYVFVAPIAIFVILAPALSRILESRREAKWGGYAIVWLAKRRILACIWAAVFAVLVFGLPILPTSSPSIWNALDSTAHSLANAFLHSTYFWAMWLAIFVGLVSYKLPPLFKALEKGVRGIEIAGKYFEPLVPAFMLAIGAYVYSLPKNLEEQFAFSNPGFELNTVEIFSIPINPSTSAGMISIYVLGALLVGIACFIWHLSLVGWAKHVVKPHFSIKNYFKKYWIKVYPLLWATSSEAIATPMNLYLVKKHFPEIKPQVRRFVIGMGSYININGTLICVIVMAGLVGALVGYSVSLLELILVIPVVFLLGYGVPGIPGELILFAGPLAAVLALPPALVPVFIGLYIGLQIGLPDSFRTGNNSTDDCLCALVLNEKYKEVK